MDCWSRRGTHYFLLIIAESFCKWNEFFNVFYVWKICYKKSKSVIWLLFFFVLLMYLFQSGDVIMIVIFLKTLEIDLIMTVLFCVTVFLKRTVMWWFILGTSCLLCLVPALRGSRPPTHPCQGTSCFDGADVLVRKLLMFFFLLNLCHS